MSCPYLMPIWRFIPACAGNSRPSYSSVRKTSVHPRVCGEQGCRFIEHWSVSGSSPRVRGTVSYVGGSQTTKRFIPACAGNSSWCDLCWSCAPVHPRVCGEQGDCVMCHLVFSGSSPRVRGTANLDKSDRDIVRFIPACAGNSGDRARFDVQTAVHPRVCGEQPIRRPPRRYSGGSSPRVRGTVNNP